MKILAILKAIATKLAFKKATETVESVVVPDESDTKQDNDELLSRKIQKIIKDKLDKAKVDQAHVNKVVKALERKLLACVKASNPAVVDDITFHVLNDNILECKGEKITSSAELNAILKYFNNQGLSAHSFELSGYDYVISIRW